MANVAVVEKEEDDPEICFGVSSDGYVVLYVWSHSGSKWFDDGRFGLDLDGRIEVSYQGDCRFKHVAPDDLWPAASLAGVVVDQMSHLVVDLGILAIRVSVMGSFVSVLDARSGEKALHSSCVHAGA